MKRRAELNKMGFTLAELLVVVAIIAILIAVSIPIFTGKLEETRETTDVANMRAAKAAATEAFLSGDYEDSWASNTPGQYTAVFDADKEYSLAMEVMGSHMDKELKRMQGLHITLMEIVILIQINNYLTMMEQGHTKVL